MKTIKNHHALCNSLQALKSFFNLIFAESFKNMLDEIL